MTAWFPMVTGLALVGAGGCAAGPGLSVVAQDNGRPVPAGVSGIGLQPPDSIPAWVYADSNLASGSSLITGQFVKSVLIVRFKSGTSVADRQGAIASVGGEVIGGRPLDGGEGWYFVRIQDDGAGASLLDAAAQLNALPQVGAATLDIVVDLLRGERRDASRLPEDDPGIEMQPPDSVPAWVYADTNLAQGSEFVSGPFLKSVLIVRFVNGASLGDRQAAIDSVNGEVIGGLRLDGAEGRYVIRVSDPGTGELLVQAETILNSLPQVAVAALEQPLGPLFRAPRDGAGWQEWQVDPSRADDDNWALELLRYPHAWGCETGNANANVAIVDIGFQNFAEALANVDPAFAPMPQVFDPARGNDHGTSVLSTLAAAGNNGVGCARRQSAQGHPFAGTGSTPRTSR